MSSEADATGAEHEDDAAAWRLARARLGGIARAASQTPAELSEGARRAAAKRWEGHTPKRPGRAEPSAKVLEFWLKRVDEREPDREWPNAEARRRAAILLMKEEQARMVLEARKSDA